MVVSKNNFVTPPPTAPAPAPAPAGGVADGQVAGSKGGSSVTTVVGVGVEPCSVTFTGLLPFPSQLFLTFLTSGELALLPALPPRLRFPVGRSKALTLRGCGCADLFELGVEEEDDVFCNFFVGIPGKASEAAP